MCDWNCRGGFYSTCSYFHWKWVGESELWRSVRQNIFWHFLIFLFFSLLPVPWIIVIVLGIVVLILLIIIACLLLPRRASYTAVSWDLRAGKIISSLLVHLYLTNLILSKSSSIVSDTMTYIFLFFHFHQSYLNTKLWSRKKDDENRLSTWWEGVWSERLLEIDVLKCLRVIKFIFHRSFFDSPTNDIFCLPLGLFYLFPSLTIEYRDLPWFCFFLKSLTLATFQVRTTRASSCHLLLNHSPKFPRT